MPEGHTIHRAARDHARALVGQRLTVSSPQGRFDVSAIAGARGLAILRGVEAYGKHLFYLFEGERIVHVHLGLFGRFYRWRGLAPEPRDTTRLRLDGASMTIDLVGPTACDVITKAQMAGITARLGPDPLRDDSDPAPFFAYVARSQAPIGAILLDQRRICGVGNVYRAEVLHLLGVHPEAPGSSIPRENLEAMWALIVGLLRRGVAEKRIVTTRGLTLARPRERVPRSDSTHVYGRPVCRSCDGDVFTYTLRARQVYFCPRCQPFGAPTERAKPGRVRSSNAHGGRDSHEGG
jgi:endonuclease-8